MWRIGLKGIATGNSDFRKLKGQDAFFIDKSLFIKDVIDSKNDVTLITRPRRFGKTLNMSMLKYFFSIEEDTKELFKDLKIMKEDTFYTDKLNSMPVVYITLKDVMGANYEEMLFQLKMAISFTYRAHENLLNSDKLDQDEKENLRRIMYEKQSNEENKKAILKLSEYLKKVYNKDVVVLLDEYDMPILNAYMNDYYEQAINFLKPFYSSSFKDNPFLYKAVLTGVSRVSKESLFSGMNNLRVCSVIKDKLYSKNFGFTTEEMEEAIKYYEEEENKEQIRAWYDGYKIGNTDGLYNPWSITQYFSDGEFRPYWLNTSSNDLIRRICRKNKKIKLDLEKLLKGEEIDVEINEETVLKNIENNKKNIWGLLIGTGYIKVVEVLDYKSRFAKCRIKIPNKEIMTLFEEIVICWFDDVSTIDGLNDILKYLIEENYEEFINYFKEMVISKFSYMDVGENTAENFYHAFVLGILVGLEKTHTVTSNRESGFGRYDIMVKPKDKTQRAFIMEFKIVREDGEDATNNAIETAFKQIEDKKYETELREEGYRNITKMAYVFKGKNCEIEIR